MKQFRLASCLSRVSSWQKQCMPELQQYLIHRVAMQQVGSYSLESHWMTCCVP